MTSIYLSVKNLSVSSCTKGFSLSFESNVDGNMKNKWHTSIQWRKAIINARRNYVCFFARQWSLIIDTLCFGLCLFYFPPLWIRAESLLTVTKLILISDKEWKFFIRSTHLPSSFRRQTIKFHFEFKRNLILSCEKQFIKPTLTLPPLALTPNHSRAR